MSDDRMDEFIDEFLLRFKKATGFDFKTGKLCASTQPPQGEPLIQGYTAEQWQEIIDGGYLCEFSSRPDFTGNCRVFGTLRDINANFAKDHGCQRWSYYRPAQLKGVMRPIFVEPSSNGTMCVFFDNDGFPLNQKRSRYAFGVYLRGDHGLDRATKYIEL